jgi:hypothetical protein
METAVALTKMLILLLPLWAAISAPLLLGLYLVARWMRSKHKTSRIACGFFALAAAFVVAPIPTPIITIFVPSVVALADRGGIVAFASQLVPWIATSLVATFVVSYFLVRRIVRPFERRANDV